MTIRAIETKTYEIDITNENYDNTGLYITQWFEGTHRSAGYPYSWYVYELTFRDENYDRGTIGKRIGADLDEGTVVQLAMEIKNSQDNYQIYERFFKSSLQWALFFWNNYHI